DPLANQKNYTHLSMGWTTQYSVGTNLKKDKTFETDETKEKIFLNKYARERFGESTDIVRCGEEKYINRYIPLSEIVSEYFHPFYDLDLKFEEKPYPEILLKITKVIIEATCDFFPDLKNKPKTTIDM